jgi:flavin-dependent dehydrogenase
MEIYWGDGCQIYVTPVTAEEVGVVAISKDHQLRFDEVLRRFPRVARRLKGKEATTAERGAVSSSRKLESVYRGRVALIGDASGSVDAITGEGLSLAFQQAVALADAIEHGDLTSYEVKHRRIGRRPAFMAALLLGMAGHSWLRRGAMRAMASNPWILSRMLSLHVGGTADAAQRQVWPTSTPNIRAWQPEIPDWRPLSDGTSVRAPRRLPLRTDSLPDPR